MNKTFKKAMASVMAMVMTVGLAASVNAAVDNHEHSSADIVRSDPYCKHPGIYKRRVNCLSKETNNHAITVIGPTGTIRQENCVIEIGTYDCYFYCKSCDAQVGYAGTEKVTKHTNSFCPSY